MTKQIASNEMKTSAWLIAGLLCLSLSVLNAAEIDVPKSLDDRLKVELFAAEPDVVAVTGLTVDAKGRVLVVESHTHFRPVDYEGPETDRIRLLEDTTGDGRADRIETFFSGTKSTMNVMAHPNGWIYVATRDSVFRIRDRDDDGKSDEKQMLVRLETTSDYPHNGLSGFAFDFSGNVYFGFGENMGQDATLVSGPGKIYFTLGQNFAEAAELIGADGRRLPALRGSGGVYLMQEDGRKLERIATGFWNPFHLCFDAFGRMFLGDNDPGNRPPCRFLSIVEGGDYGYRRRTLEPFIAINGEVPGTLPMTSSTGESPTGTLTYESGLLPADYRGDVLVTTWGEHRVDRYRLQRDGAHFTVKTQPMVAGGEHFRPAGIAVAPDGSLYVGDWADRSYPLHGKGRVWHITLKQPNNVTPHIETDPMLRLRSPDLPTREAAARSLLSKGEVGIAKLATALRHDTDARVRSVALTALISADVITKPLADRALSDSDEAVREQAARTLPRQWIDLPAVVRRDPAMAVQAAALRRVADSDSEALILVKLGSADPFMRQAARRALGQSVKAGRLLDLTSHAQADVRLAAVLLLRGGPNDTGVWEHLPKESIDAVVTRGIHDSNPRVRFAVAEWIGREEWQAFRPTLIDGLAQEATTPPLFEAYLAALAQVDGVMRHWTKSTVGDWWLTKADSQQTISKLLDDPRTSTAVLRQVLLFLPPDHPAVTLEKLQEFAQSPDQALRLESVRQMRALKSKEAKAELIALASKHRESSELRAEAIIGLDASESGERKLLISLLSDDAPVIRHESLRTLRGANLDEEQRAKLLTLDGLDPATAELVQRVLMPEKTISRPKATNLDRWRELLNGQADANAGQRVFFHPQGPGCGSCHRIDGRGTAIGPSFVRMDGRLPLERDRMIEAILQPSKDIDPGYLPVSIVTTDGRTAYGIYHKHSGAVRSVYDSQGKIQSFKVDEIEQVSPSKNSIMPDGLASLMTLQEFRDILAYLSGPALPETSTADDSTCAP